MHVFERRITVEWGDCDEAGIVFYPNYFYWFDCTYQAWLRQAGLSQRILRQEYDAVTPLVDVGANFRAPVTYDREIRVCVHVAQWLERRFKLEYQVFNMDGVLVATGHEWRAWAQVLPEGRLKGAAIAQDFRQRLEGNGAV
ncbi:acyl-CoA thioesterase [Alcaligenes faecalis]|uniref:acyl-CoA thioesterase n=1 Tax=Alcaligenes faecalis TaxID=511 RepID=UPI0012930016|nr:acyl-CoA thioesterase [Alcaligenes faecalis]QFY76805.1 acyl-CoA thioesterase [Alcaligenes faecalis]